MNPISALRTLRDIATRRPLLVGAVGLGLLGEAARVGSVLVRGGTATLFGHSGATNWRTAEDEVWIAGYVAWVGICGLIVLASAVSALWARRRAAAPPVATASPPPAARTPQRAIPAASAVVVRRREGETKWPARRR
jgi:hypothetical protein